MDQNLNKGSEQIPAEIREGGVWRIFVFMLFLSAVLFLAYAGLNFGYKTFLNNSISNLDIEINEVEARFDSGESRDLIIFYSQMVNLRELLNSHIFASKTFPFLESSTSSNVAYSTVTISTDNNELIIDGIASSFETLVQQLLFWQRSPNIADIILQENSLANDLVNFRVRLVLVPEFFRASPEYLEIIRDRDLVDESDVIFEDEIELEEPTNNNETN